MGVVRTCEMKRAEFEAYRRKLVADSTVLHRRKDLEPPENKTMFGGDYEDGDEGTLVCVTSGVSYLGIALVNQLLQRGYSVRITVDNQEEVEKVMEMKVTERNMEVIMAKLTDVDSLEKAFEGCYGVFHTSAFTDPAGLSGYTKSMAEIEVRVTENVMEACARTPSIKRCVFTSSLSVCVWQEENNFPQLGHSSIINHDSWSSESLCIEKKLWYALGKLRAEKTAWRIAKEKGLKLTTICPALITGPEFCHKNPTATIAYLKGAQEMYSQGLLATIDVTKLAEAHACVFKAMKTYASGRYICFDNVIENQSDAEKLVNEIGMPKVKICGGGGSDNSSLSNSLHRSKLSNEKLARLMSRTLRCFSEY